MKSRSVQIIGVPLDLGANIRGANMGPAAIRIADLHYKLSVLGCEVVDIGDLSVPIRDTLPAEAQKGRFLHEIAVVCEDLQRRVHEALAAGRIPLVVGGDHSIAIGTISGAARFARDHGSAMGLIWMDAHADINTPATTPTGNIHGMPLGVILGNGHPELLRIGGQPVRVKPENVALVGIRTLDSGEKELCKKSGIRYFTMREIDERGLATVMREAIEVATRGTAALHLSFDMDVIDPLYAPGVSTTVTGGLSYREAHLALEMIADTGKLTSMEFTELNPMHDHKHTTAQFLVELVQSALGKSIV